MITNLETFKEKKKLKKVIQDLERIEYLFNIIMKGMGSYKKYKPVKEVLYNIMENKGFVLAHLKQYKKLLNEKEQSDKLDKDGE